MIFLTWGITMEFSLIMGTLNRCKEVNICLTSLMKQNFTDFEIIIIDQSTNNETKDLINEDSFKKLLIKYKKVDFRGLSRARNEALKLASGKYFALIDDDASYDENYLRKAHDQLNTEEKIILSGYIYSPLKKNIMKDYCVTKNGAKLTLRKILRMAPSPALVFPMELYKKGLRFDEEFGVGAKYGACEETDIILRALDEGYAVRYCSEMIVQHPTIVHSFEVENTTIQKKRESYSFGLGALFAKDKLYRGSSRLLFYEIEKKVKLYIKKTGFFGNNKKQQAISELRGLVMGKREYGERTNDT